MDAEGNPELHEESAKWFIDFCADKFGWRDLSKDVVMDVGCGLEGFCGRALLDKFPDVGTILGIDSNTDSVKDFKPKSYSKMACEFADIQISDTLRYFGGRMTKVVSTHVFHQLREEEVAFQNIFDLLKPEGEAGVLFVVWALIDDWEKVMIKIHKWKEFYKGPRDGPPPKRKAAEYRKIVEKIGFRVILCEEKMKSIPYPSRDRSIETFMEICGNYFNIPSGLTGQFKEEGFNQLLKLSAKDARGRMCYRQKELSLLLQKPA